MLNLSEDEFYKMTPRAFANKQQGWQELRDSDERQRWELIRSLGVRLLMPHLKKGTNVNDVWVLPWDNAAANTKKESPEEALKRAQKTWEKIDNKKKKKEDG